MSAVKMGVRATWGVPTVPVFKIEPPFRLLAAKFSNEDFGKLLVSQVDRSEILEVITVENSLGEIIVDPTMSQWRIEFHAPLRRQVYQEMILAWMTGWKPGDLLPGREGPLQIIIHQGGAR